METGDIHKYWQDVLKEIKASDKNQKQHQILASIKANKDKLRFAKIYSYLTHSGTYTEEIINLELSYQPVVDEMLETRDTSIAERQIKSSKDIEAAVMELGRSHTEATISSLSSQHCQDIERLLNNWNMSIEALKDAQREQFYEKLETLWEQYSISNGKIADNIQEIKKKESPKFPSPLRLSVSKTKVETICDNTKYLYKSDSHQDIMEESFTINLGSQLKTTHNLRLLAIDTLYLCDFQRYHLHQARIQTAMSLYSKNLSAIVMLVDNQFKSYYGTQYEFSQMCNRLNEFHFDSIDNQISYIRDKLMPLHAGRQCLEIGDCYVTRHSNLANVHLVFHLVGNDSLKNGSMNSRHPILSSIRNILRMAHVYDIKTISIPLLLVDGIDEEILTVDWSLKRAELVLKCVKGYLIEMASMSSGIDQGTIQFLLPRGISQDLFENLTVLVTKVFRLSTSLKFGS